MGHTADEDDLLNVPGLQLAGIVEGLLAGVDSVLNERVYEGLKPRTKEPEVDTFGTRSVHANEREADFGLSGGRKLDLGLLNGLTNIWMSWRYRRDLYQYSLGWGSRLQVM